MTTARPCTEGSRLRGCRATTLDAPRPRAVHEPGEPWPRVAPSGLDGGEDAVRALPRMSTTPCTTTDHGSWSMSRNASASGHFIVTRRARLISNRDGSDFSGTTPRGEGQAGWQPTPLIDTVSSEAPRQTRIDPTPPPLLGATGRHHRTWMAFLGPVSPAQRERIFLAETAPPTHRSRAPTSESSTR